MVFASGFPAAVANRKDGDVPFDDGYLCDFLTALHMCLFTGSVTATTIKSQSSSNLGLRSFMLAVRARRGKLWWPSALGNDADKLHFGTAGWTKQNRFSIRGWRSASFDRLHNHRLCAGMAEALPPKALIEAMLSHLAWLQHN
jgi:hypothetical protein